MSGTSVTTNNNDLTEQEQQFLDCLFDEELNPDMDPAIAKRAAGYAKRVPIVKIISGLQGKLQDDIQSYFLSKAPLAARKVVGMLENDNPIPGSERILQAAREVLDRGGVTKKEKAQVEIKMPIGVIPLPALRETIIEHIATNDSSSG